jgi:deoxyadenosine/deoxycytidine kinase
MYDFIAIEGNIGAGKTTLSTMIAEQTGRKLILEEFADNPFLPKFYKDQKSNAFPLELFFLAERYHQLKNHFSAPDLFQQKTITDYFIGKSLVFSRSNLDEDELRLFNNLYSIMFSSLPKPDLLVYLFLDIEGLQRNIKKRGRSFEQDMQNEYLVNIQKGYLDFLKQQKDLRTLVVDINNIDFVEDKTQFKRLFGLIERNYPKGLTYLDLSGDI